MKALAAIAAAVTMGAGIVTAAPAHADEATFIEDAANAGFFNHSGAAAELDVGRNMCSELDSGWSRRHVIDDLWQAGPMTRRSAAHFVGIAIRDLCPWDGSDYEG
jgi:hypothetical protein